MKILPINSTSQIQNIKTSSFKANFFKRNNKEADMFVSTIPKERGRIYNGNKVYNITTTEFFREDINWKNFGDFLKEHFKDSTKVNTYVFGSSMGDEVFTLSGLLHGKFGEKAEKFFPIMPSDIEAKNVKTANDTLKGGKVNFFATDYDNSAFLRFLFERNLKDCECQDFFYVRDDVYRGDFVCFLLKPIQNSIMPFEQKNILEEVQNINSENPGLILCRNMWPYVGGNEYPEFAKNLYNQVKEGSCIVIGDVDYDKKFVKNNCLISEAFLNAGFKQVDSPLLKTEFQKKPYIFIK